MSTGLARTTRALLSRRVHRPVTVEAFDGTPIIDVKPVLDPRER